MIFSIRARPSAEIRVVKAQKLRVRVVEVQKLRTFYDF